VYPAASLTQIAIDRGAATIQVNLNPTEIDGSVTWSIRGPAGAVLPQIVDEAWGAD
jgi:NAD-dependent SIR2 family protein deacetylase